MPRSMTVSVISENTFQVSQAAFFPTLLKEDVVSHPVRAWKGSALDFFCPSYFLQTNVLQYILVLLDPKAIKISPIDKA